MKIGVLREGKIPPDRRVPLTPEQCREVEERFAGVTVVVQPSMIRCFHDESYLQKGIKVQEDLTDCDVLLGVKEVPARKLIPGKTYFFFSHTIKKQEYNRKLLQTILRKHIRLIDYEALTGRNGFRILGFGRWAGLVGAYSGLRAYGLRNRLFDLPPAYLYNDIKELFKHLDHLTMPPLKVAVTGDGKVASGVREVLDHAGVKRLPPDLFLEIDVPEVAVYTQLSPKDYVRRKDGKTFSRNHFFSNPGAYQNAFIPYAHATDLLIAAAYWDPRSPVLFTAKDMKEEAFRINTISDITCDIEGAIPSTRRASNHEEPYYDYNPDTGELEPPFSSVNNITVQAVDNLPNELPKNASADFGKSLIEKVLPALFDSDTDSILERATITRYGQLTEKYSYLHDFVNP